MSTTNPMQLTIFDSISDGVLTAEKVNDSVYADLETTDFFSRDIISLTDVPLSNDLEVKMIAVSVPGNDGHDLVLNKPGKVLRRTGPHPTLVKFGDRLCARDAVPVGAAVKPVMVPFITIIVYDGGVVQPAHHDVLHVILGAWHERYKQTGNASTQIRTTVAEIAKKMDMGSNARIRTVIREALSTIRGVTITKQYALPEDRSAIGTDRDKSAMKPGQGKETIAGIFSYVKIETSLSPTRVSEEVVIEINPGLMRAMTGDTKERPWLTRSFNYTKNLAYHSKWKRQLALMVEQRLERSKKFAMPIIELWVSCLGHDQKDVFGKNWRTIVHRIKKMFEEWETAGWIKDFEWSPKYGKPEDLEMEGAAMTSIDVELTDGKKGRIDLDRFVSNFEIGGWVRCEAGPFFGTEQGIRKSKLARDVAVATTKSHGDADALIKQHGSDFVIDLAYGRLKNLLNLIGDRILRLSFEKWFSNKYPKPDRVELIRYNFRQWKHANDSGPTTMSPFDRRRTLFVSTIMKKKVGDLAVEDILNGKKERPDHLPLEVFAEYVMCLQEALECYMNNVDGVSRDILQPINRIGKPEIQRTFVDMMSSVHEVATVTAGQMLWFAQVAKSPDIEKLEDQAFRRGWLLTVAKRYPKAYDMVSESQRADRSQWEVTVGRALEQRLCEHVIEAEQLEKKVASSGLNL